MRFGSEHQSRIAAAVERFDQLHRRAIVGSIGMVAGLGLLGIPFIEALMSHRNKGGPYLPGDEFSYQLLILLLKSFLFGAGTPAIGYTVYGKLARRRGIVLWLRRFRPGYQNRLRFHRVLEQACLALAHPITVQDSSYRSSLTAGTLRAWPLLVWANFFATLGLVGIMSFPLLTLPAGSVPSRPQDVSFNLTVGILGWITFVLVVFVWLAQRMGVMMPRGGRARSQVKLHLHRLKSGEEGVGMGVEVIRCEDSTWREVVSQAISQAHIVLIDVTEPSESLLWELGEALKHGDENSVLLACEQDSIEVARAWLEGLRSKVPQKRALEWLERSLFTYPSAEVPLGSGRKRQYREIARRLRRELAARLSGS